MRLSRPMLFAFAFLLSPVFASAQQSPATLAPTVSDPQAIALIQRSLAALTGGVPISDVTLTGTARRIAGSDDETGTATLTAIAAGSSKLALNLPSGMSTEVRGTSDSEQSPQQLGAWSGADGTLHPMEQHNVLTDATWFFPAFNLNRISSQAFQVSYVGREDHNDIPAVHVAVRGAFPGLAANQALLQHLTAMDIYLDPATLVPVALDFNLHPDNNAAVDIPVEIRFSSYQLVNRIQIPFHIQKYVNNGLVLDLELDNAAIDSGLGAASFRLQ